MIELIKAMVCDILTVGIKDVLLLIRKNSPYNGSSYLNRPLL